MEQVPFNGLTMPVFTAFGWAGEETAQEFALSQLEQFAAELSGTLSLEARGLFPHHGLDRVGRAAIISATEPAEEGLQIAFEARPMALKVTVILSDREALQKALSSAEAEPVAWHRALIELDPEWNLRIQQMEVDAESGAATHYKDVYKDSVNTLKPELTAELLARAAYLNSEDRWLAPIYITRRLSAEFVAAMGRTVAHMMAEEIETMLPVLKLLGGPKRRSRSKAKSRSGAKAEEAQPAAPKKSAKAIAAEQPDTDERFTYAATLKPLHLRKGFINLTPAHWPFFAVNSRTQTRPVTVYFENGIDKASSVWRLVPDDLARLVLGRNGHDWLADNFDPEDDILVTAVKADDDSIDITLAAP